MSKTIPRDGAIRKVTATWDGEKMDLLPKVQWVTKLLDGSVKQTRGALCNIPVGRFGGKREKRYCCLGVKAVCDGEQFAIPSWARESARLGAGLLSIPARSGQTGVYFSEDFPIGLVHATGVAYDAVLKAWVPWEEEFPTLSRFLVDANDRFRWSFKKIGTWIYTNV